MDKQVIFGTFDGLKVYIDAGKYHKYDAEKGTVVVVKSYCDFYCYEHYPCGKDGEYISIKTHLTNNIDELKKIIADFQDWSYRCSHGELDYILNEEEKLSAAIQQYKALYEGETI